METDAKQAETEEFRRWLKEVSRPAKRAGRVCDLDRKLYGCASRREYIARAFPARTEPDSLPAWKTEPVFWRGGELPAAVREKKLLYLVRFRAHFQIREGRQPFVMNKTSFLYPKNEPLKDSHPRAEYGPFCRNVNGDAADLRPVLTLTGGDFELFQESYEVSKLEILDGCYFPEERLS